VALLCELRNAAQAAAPPSPHPNSHRHAAASGGLFAWLRGGSSGSARSGGSSDGGGVYSRLASASPVVGYDGGGYSAFSPLVPPHAYAVADHSHAPPPPPPPRRAAVPGAATAGSGAGTLGRGGSSVRGIEAGGGAVGGGGGDDALTKEAVLHFAACVRDLGRRGTAAARVSGLLCLPVTRVYRKSNVCSLVSHHV
jgi:hypothetical protein